MVIKGKRKALSGQAQANAIAKTNSGVLPIKRPPSYGVNWTQEEIEGAIAWVKGSVVYAIKPPFRRRIDETTFPLDKIPPGLTVMKSYKR